MLPLAAECQSSNLPLSGKIVLAERWQQSPQRNGRSCWLRDCGERAPVLSASMVPGEMPQATSWIQENRGALYAKSDSDPQVPIRYCTVTRVPTGISEKNLRAASSGNRMQPCDAG